MKRLAIILVASSLSLAGCATVPNLPVTTIDRVQARYDAVKAWADLIMPYVSSARATRIRLGLTLTERGLKAARAAATIGEQRAALNLAKAATESLQADVPPLKITAAGRRLGNAQPAATPNT